MSQDLVAISLVVISIIPYLITTLWSVALLPRIHNWPIRLLALVTGFLPLHQSIVLLQEKGIWTMPIAGQQLAHMFEPVVSGLFLFVPFLLELDCMERKGMETRLRIAEAGSAPADRPGKSSRYSAARARLSRVLQRHKPNPAQ